MTTTTISKIAKGTNVAYIINGMVWGEGRVLADKGEGYVCVQWVGAQQSDIKASKLTIVK